MRKRTTCEREKPRLRSALCATPVAETAPSQAAGARDESRPPRRILGVYGAEGSPPMAIGGKWSSPHGRSPLCGSSAATKELGGATATRCNSEGDDRVTTGATYAARVRAVVVGAGIGGLAGGGAPRR